MKQIIFALLILLAVGFASQAQSPEKGRAVVCFQSSMNCQNCQQTLYDQLRFEKGVKDLKVDHASNTILIEYLEGKNNEKSLAGVVEKKGYKAEKISREKYNSLVEKAKEKNHDQVQEPGHKHQ